MAVGPSSSSTRLGTPASSAARFVSVFLTTREAGAVLEHLGPHAVDLGHRQAAVVRDDQRVGCAQPLDELCDHPFLVSFQQRITS